MSEIYFENEYIIVKPSYRQTRKHKHNMLHLFVGKHRLKLTVDEGIITGSIIILEKDLLHMAPEGEMEYFLFIDPTSRLAEEIRINYLKGANFFAGDDKLLSGEGDLDAVDIKRRLLSYFGNDVFMKKQDLDERVVQMLGEIDSFMYAGKRISDIAGIYGYSESYLTHLFKHETGVPLKNYMLMRQFEYAWIMINKGEKITEAVLEAGFASSSHFSDVCRRLTGISAMDVLKELE
ncbi:MAG: AraC family transcriptional regulator [Lachnospiraceae bacterium]|nr:AraC family transcriptional regulator [Lachnospiraceae bacterium]